MYYFIGSTLTLTAVKSKITYDMRKMDVWMALNDIME